MPAAVAQVNIEPIREQVEDTGFGARLDGSLTTYLGNTQGMVLGVNALVGVSGGSHLAFVNASGDYTRLGDETQVAKSFAHARYNYELEPWLWAELFGQLETDRFRRIRLRALAGTGPRLKVLESERLQLYLGTAYMLEHTQLNEGVRASGTPELAHRWSSYLSVGLELHEQVQASNVTYYQPRWDDFSDFRLLNVTGLAFTVTDLISTRVDALVRYESWHSPEVGPLDAQIKNSISLTL